MVVVRSAWQKDRLASRTITSLSCWIQTTCTSPKKHGALEANGGKLFKYVPMPTERKQKNKKKKTKREMIQESVTGHKQIGQHNAVSFPVAEN